MSSQENTLKLEKLQSTGIIYVVNEDDYEIHKCEFISTKARTSTLVYTMNGETYSDSSKHSIFSTYEDALKYWKERIIDVQELVKQRVQEKEASLAIDKNILDKVEKLITLF